MRICRPSPLPITGHRGNFRDSRDGMPTKLQLKTLSNSGELLNVINCSAGRISVFRGNTPADLRPYQRALIGTSGKEKMIVLLDGAEYSPENQNMIGLGEAAPHAGLSVRDFLGKVGLRDAALDGLLSSFGLESVVESKMSALSPDQERRVRILFAVNQPEKALIINEPFEVITSQWRERFAEVLLDFARMKNGMVVIPSLSYRPESWIDNSLIARIEVGQSIQRTIGFGQAGSDANQMMEELKRKLREDDANEKQPRREGALVGAAAAAGIAPVSQPSAPPPQSDLSLIKSWLLGGESKVAKLAASFIAAAIGVGSAVVIMDLGKSPEPENRVAAVVTQPQPSALPKEAPTSAIDKAINSGAEQQQPSAPASKLNVTAPLKVRLLLDDYPEVIRASIIETSRGNVGEVAAPEAPKAEQPAPGQAKSGNLYSLLEKASSESAGPGGGSASQPMPQYEPEASEPDSYEEEEPVDQTAEDQKREEIRAKFLEAIRAAAERREAAMDEE